jgi:hypothetical protein
MAEPHEDLGEWVHSLDREVTSLGRTVASVHATVDAHGTQLDKVEHGIEQILVSTNRRQPPIQIFAALAAIFTVIGGFTVFVNMRISPTELAVADMRNSAAAYVQLISDNSAKILADHSENRYLEDVLRHLDEQHHVTQDRVTETEKQVSEMRGYYSYDLLQKK